MRCTPILTLKLNSAFSHGAGRQLSVLYEAMSTHKFSCLWLFFFQSHSEYEYWDKAMAFFFTISWYDLQAGHNPPWPGFVIGNTAGGAGTLCSVLQSWWAALRVGLSLPPFASALVTPCSLAHQSALHTTGDPAPLTTPKFHGSQALFSQLPSLFLLEWVTEACSDAAPFPGELSRSVVCMCVCVCVWE